MKLSLKFVNEYQRIAKEMGDARIKFDYMCWFIDQDIFSLQRKFLDERAAFEENLLLLEKYISVEQQLLDAGKKILEEASEAVEASDSEG